MRNIPLLISHLELSIAPTTVVLPHQALIYQVTKWSPGDGTEVVTGGRLMRTVRQMDPSLEGVAVLSA